MYYRCTNCGQMYYSAATLKDEQLNCEKCGAKVEPVSNNPQQTDAKNSEQKQQKF